MVNRYVARSVEALASDFLYSKGNMETMKNRETKGVFLR